MPCTTKDLTPIQRELQRQKGKPTPTKEDHIKWARLVQAWLTHPAPCPPEVRRRGLWAREQFVVRNLRFAASQVNGYRRVWEPAGLTFDVAMSFACTGLQRAAESTNPTGAYSFLTHAGWWVRSELMRGVAKEMGPIAVPANQRQMIRWKAQGRELPPKTRLDLMEAAATASSVLALDAMISDEGNAYEPPTPDRAETNHALLERIFAAAGEHHERLEAVLAGGPKVKLPKWLQHEMRERLAPELVAA
jgi:hypothetical protein